MFVIIAIIFFVMILGTMFMMMKSKETLMAKEIDQIKASYEEKTNADEVYTTIANESDKYVTQGMIENLVEQKMNEKVMTIYPVGSIYISTNNQNPSGYIGGEWESYGQGRTLVGAGTGTDANNVEKVFNINETGGEYKHTLTIAEMPNHKHGTITANQGGTGTYKYGMYPIASTKSNITTSYNLYAGGDEAHNNIQPYIVTYMWKRIK